MEIRSFPRITSVIFVFEHVELVILQWAELRSLILRCIVLISKQIIAVMRVRPGRKTACFEQAA